MDRISPIVADSRPSPSADPRSDEALVEAIQGGETEALGPLFVRHVTTVRRLLLSVMGPRDDLDDRAQEVFLQVHRSIGNFRKESRFTTWLHKIAVRTAVNALRRPNRLTFRDPVDAHPPDPGAGPEDRAVNRERIRRLFALLETLSVKRHVAFALFAVDGRSIREIAGLLGVPESVVKSRIFFARRALFKQAAEDPYLAPLLEEWTP